MIDLTRPLGPETPVYPDYPPLEVTVLDTSLRPSPPERPSLNSSRVAVGLHCGTHMDAPFHFITGGGRIEQVPLTQCVGAAVLVRLPEHGAGAEIRVEDLEPYAEALRSAGKVLLATGWEHRWGQPGYFSEHPVITGEAAGFLLRCGIHLVGVDFPSVDLPPHPAHYALLGAGCVIVENLWNLEAIPGERCHFTAAPLPLTGREASPVRAYAVPLP